MEIPRLHPDTIEDVKQRVDIVDVVSEHVVLRKRGKDYVGLCPFHDEKTPSFSVSPGKQIYYCFGCNAGGNAIKFLMEVGKRAFSDVVLDLARRYQVPVQTLEPEQRATLQRELSLREQLYEILALTTAFYQHALLASQGQQALTYLRTTRRLSEETIQQFQLGYAPAGWETLYKYLVQQKGKPVQQVEQAGLIAPRKSGGGYYDRFRDRLIIPIYDERGRVIGFGGRSLGDEQPKYLNSPETPLFDKGKTLFALDKARDAIAKLDQAVVVEGYFDAIALHAAGIRNVVATLGTALSSEQVRLILRYTESKQIVLNFDADKAGTQASERAIAEIAPLVYGGQVQLRVLNLPDGKDADEFLNGHSDAAQQYQQQVQDAPLWLDWLLSQLLLGYDLKQADQFQQVAQKMVKLLNQLDNVNQLTYYVNHCAQLLSQGQTKLVPLLIDNLQAQLKKPVAVPFKKSQTRSYNQKSVGTSKDTSTPVQSKSKDAPKPSFNLSIGSASSLLERAEALLLRIYLHRPEYRQAIIDALEARDLLFSLSHHRFLWQQILDLQPIVQLDDTGTQGHGDTGMLEKDSPRLGVSPSGRLFLEASSQTSDSLISLLQERSIQYPEKMARVTHLFHLDEKCQEDISRTPLVIRAAAACLEMIACENHRRYCLEQWQKLDSTTDFQLKQYYLQEFYEADRQLKELEQIRQANFSDVIELSAS